MTSSAALLSLLAGLALGLSLIVAIGAQNAFVLEQGLAGRYVVPVVAVCVLSDVTLIVAGTGGAGAVLAAAPSAVGVVRLVGAAFLAGYAAVAARRAWRGGRDALTADGGRGARGLLPVLATCLAFTWLNPHVYLDTVVLLGSIAAGHGGTRWWFAAGACVASVLWFSALGAGASLLRPLFARPAAWRVLDAGIAVMMAGLAVAVAVS